MLDAISLKLPLGLVYVAMIGNRHGGSPGIVIGGVVVGPNASELIFPIANRPDI